MSNNKNITVGILAIQGDYERHQRHLNEVGVQSKLIRLPDELKAIDGLIIPGGESTTMNIMVDRFHLRDSLIEFGQSKPVWGTCAGMIMLSSEIEDNIAGVKPFGLLDVSVLRNGYGRQVHSFSSQVDFQANGHAISIEAVFIRAPKITKAGKNITSLAEYEGDPIVVQQGRLLASSFHSELTDDTTVLKHFLSIF